MQNQSDFVKLIEDVLSGKYDNHPIMQSIKRMTANKSGPEQVQILLNMLSSSGFDINQKIHIPDELARKYGLIP